MADSEDIEARNFAETLKKAFVAASSYDNTAEDLLSQNDPDYVESVKCHKLAYDELVKVLSSIPIDEQHRMMLSNIKRPLLEALYSHIEYHFNMRSSLMARDQILTDEMKRKLYIESIKDRALELSSLDVNNKMIERQFSLQENLLDSLEEKCSQAIDELPEEEGVQKLKSMKDKIDKLKIKNAHCKQLLDGYVTDYIQLQAELKVAKGEHNSEIPSEEIQQTSIMSADELTYPFNSEGTLDDDGIQFAPLEMPPEFEILDNINLSFASPLDKSSLVTKD